MIYFFGNNVAVNYERFNLDKRIALEKGYAVSNLVVFSILFNAEFVAWFFWDVMISIEVELQMEINKKGIQFGLVPIKKLGVRMLKKSV